MKKILFGLISILSLSSAHAINFQHYQFSDSFRYSILDDSLAEAFPGSFVISSSLAQVKDPVYISDRDVTRVYGSFIEYNRLLTLTASYYLSKDLSLGANINAVETKVLGKKRTGLSDSSLKLKYNLYRDKTYSLSLNPALLLPTGDTASYSSTDALGGEINLVGEAQFQDFHFLTSLGYRHSEKNRLGIIDYRDLLLLGVGASYDFSAKFTGNIEINRDFTMIQDYRQDIGGYYLTLKYKTHENFSLYAGLGVAGFDEIDRNTQTAFMGLKFSY